MSQTLKRIDETAKTHLNNVIQLAVFKLNDDNYYGINVSKIRAFEDFGSYKQVKGSGIDSEILDGYIQYRDLIIPVLNIEKWLGTYKEGSVYREYIICEFNKETLALPISDIDNIFNVKVENLQKPEIMREVVTYSTLIEIDGGENICLVLDVEKLLADSYGVSFDYEHNVFQVESSKVLLIAEDSRTAQEIFKEIFKNSNINYKIFDDGVEIIEYVNSLSNEELKNIGMIITDIEMPRKDGYQVIKELQSQEKYKSIPIAINTSMSNEGVAKKARLMGVTISIAKTDPEAVMRAVREHML